LGYRPEDTDGGTRAEAEGFGGWLHRALGEAAGSGSYIVPDEYRGTVWDLLAADAVGLRSGFSVIETSSDTLHLPVIDADVAAAWTAEADPITPGDPTIAEVIAYPRGLKALVALSNELIADSNPSAISVVTRSMIRALALKFDLAAFEGSGVGVEVKGLKNVTGIQEVTLGVADGAPFTDLDPFAEAIGLLAAENATATAIVLHPRTWTQLTKLKETAASVKPLMQESAGSGAQGVVRSIYGVPVYVSSQLSITETQGGSGDASSAYVYQADQVIAVRRAETRVEYDRSRLFNTDQSELRAVLRMDVVVPHPKAVCRIKGIVPA
ncbi:MAG: phage major capsid protein, partial [Gaiellaceae bacterium]